ncbi:MAG: glycerol kinase [Bacteroidetes bacterium]|nr:MAG: glycerol kinase [Bacteroidota bacterium]RLD48369.1 MAG: glycerol kinase [Bacteroidota bacterium]
MKKKKYILSLDQGTTSSRAIIYNEQGEICSVAQKEYRQIFPQPGWVEHDPMDIWSSQIGVASEVIARFGVQPEEIAAIGITNQRETTIIWDRATGKPVYHAIVWQDHRTAGICEELKKSGYGELIKQKTGLEIDAYFSATKIKWILDNVRGAKRRAAKGELAFGTVDTWLVWNLTHGRTHVTDVTNASRTMLFNISTMTWDEELLKLFDIPVELLPEVVPNDKIIANSTASILNSEIPIAGLIGDQQAALFGQMCIEKGMAKNTYGTGCFLMMNIGNRPAMSSNRLITTIAWKLGDKPTYALEGSVFVGGAVVQWLRDELDFFEETAEVEAMIKTTPDNNGVYFVPAFTGLGAPYWDQHARGIITGITRGTKKEHIARAALESVAYQSYDVFHAMEQDIGVKIKTIRVDGGASANNFLMQFQADILQKTVQRPAILETTSLGAAYLAGLNTGYWKDIPELAKQWTLEKKFNPKMDKKYVKKYLEDWHIAVQKTF